MRTIFEIPTRGDDINMPGGIALRFDSVREEVVVHNYTTDRDTGTERNYFNGSYFTAGSLTNRFMNGLCNFMHRAEEAGSYITGGSIDIEALLENWDPAV